MKKEVNDQQGNVKKKGMWIKQLYSLLYGLLVSPFFRAIGNVFSHGAVHFCALFLIGALTAWLFYKNSTIEIIPHNVGFDLHWTNTHNVYLPSGTVQVSDSIRDLQIHIELNSNEAESKTKGKYHNRIVFEFEGTSVPTYRLWSKNKYPVFKPINQGREDSVEVKLFSDPFLSDAFVDISSEEIFLDTIIKSNREWQTNEKGNKYFLGDSEIFHVVPETDTTSYVISREKDNSLLSIKLVPKQIDKMGKKKSPRQTVSIYSENLGVSDNNPYYYYFFAFPSTKLQGSIKLDFRVSDLSTQADFNFMYARNQHLQFNYVFPQPDVINNGYIEYHTKEKIEQIKENHGVIIQAVDVKTLNQLNNLSFLYSVLVGTGLAFLIDIIVQLIRELRNVNKRYRKAIKEQGRGE